MKLVLSDGTLISGKSFGALRSVSGEVVTNTCMTGYVEALTDPSYRGQILVLTYPLQGNYGRPLGPFESSQIQVRGLIVYHSTKTPSHHTCVQTLGEWLKIQKIPAIEGVDTRSLARHLRNHGPLSGDFLFDEEDLQDGLFPLELNREAEGIIPLEVIRYEGGGRTIVLVDTGVKESVIRSFQSLGVSVIRVPWQLPWESYLQEGDGVVFTNGPGDPADFSDLMDRVRNVLHLDIPVFGICLGHQLLGLAAGAKTYSLQFGHRSHNHPVLDLMTRRAYLTSQNHGYAVDSLTLPVDWNPWFVSLNDGSNEGIRHQHKPFSSVQFHPEAAGGPRDTLFLLEAYIQQVSEVGSVSQPWKKIAQK